MPSGADQAGRPQARGVGKRMRKLLITIATVAGLLSVSLFSAAVTSPSAADADLSQLSNDELAKSAHTMVQKMESQLTESFKLLEASLAGGDVGATTARNEAITKIKSLVKLSEENFKSLQESLATGDRERAEHEHVKIAITAAKVSELMAQVRTAGGIDVDVESTEVDLNADYDGEFPLLPELSATFLDTPDLVPDPPIHASPYF
jgi:hypothetical protein